MTQCNSLNVKLSNSKLNKLKFAVKSQTGLVLSLSSNVFGDDETNFPHKLSLTNRQVESLRKAFANKSSTDIKLSKTRLSNMIQSGVFLGRLLGPLLKAGLPLIKNVIKPIATSVLIPDVPASAADTGIHKKILGSGCCHSSSLVLCPPLPNPLSSARKTTTIIISNEKMKDVTEIVKSLEDSGLLLNKVSKRIQNDAKEQKG